MPFALPNNLDHQCGLMNPGNPCRCSKKAKAAVEAGYINPDNLQFTGRCRGRRYGGDG